MASSVVLPSSQLASFKNQQLGGLLTGSGAGVAATPQSAALNALQARSKSPVAQMATKTQNSVAAGNQRLSAINALKPKAVGRATGGGDVAVGAPGNPGSDGWVDVGNGQRAAPAAAAHLKALMSAANASGYKIGVTEAGRTRARQQQLYNLYKSGKGNLAAAPGHSVHEQGNAFDLNGYGGGTNSPQFKWLLANASKYGFSWKNGRSYGEPWHWEYTG